MLTGHGSASQQALEHAPVIGVSQGSTYREYDIEWQRFCALLHVCSSGRQALHGFCRLQPGTQAH
jgi:hypothetical protein